MCNCKSSEAFCLRCLRHADLDGAAIAAEMNIVSAAADGGRIHAVTRAALSSIPDGPDRFWRHLCDALRGAALLWSPRIKATPRVARQMMNIQVELCKNFPKS